MPNWVHNSIYVYGEKKQLTEFLEKSTQPYETDFEPMFEETRPQKHTGFSFWNFIAPPANKLNEYFAKNGSHRDEVTGEIVRTGDTTFNWYNWNNANWDTKWDACDAECDLDEDGTQLFITFNTAWSYPEPVFIKMCEQYPKLQFEFAWEEEQGWGGHALGQHGEYMILDQYDIPEGDY